MCGIAGLLTKDGAPPDEARLRRMASRIAHRGPDGEGIWSAPGVGLVHRRLAIIDVSPRGAQPMHDARGKLSIVFNGEIYNYRELRDQLHADWQSETDTEVLLEGYWQWGDAVVEKLRGMFAFVLWDHQAQRALIARDRIGKKPLFYATTPVGDLAFASEMKALHEVVSPEVDHDALRLFLGLQYVPSPRTGFRNISQLEPGTLGVWSEGSFATQRYHAWQSRIETRSVRDTDAYIREHLHEAVKIRQLAADVPVGAFLSGGVDSAAVVAYASRHVSTPLQTFTMGFAEREMDERNEAAQVARRFKTDHHAFEARPEHLLECADRLIAHYDAPYADSSALPLWLLARETAKQIKVVLTGDGGDELFGGYRRYLAFQRALWLGKSPLRFAVPPITSFIGQMGHDPRFIRMADVVRSVTRGTGHGYGELFCGSYFGSRGIHELCTPEFLERSKQADAVEYIALRIQADQARISKEGGSRSRPSALQDGIFFDLTSYLPDDLNVKMDRATMAFGLEARAPFLDQKLVAFALTLPRTELVSGRRTKIALTRALRGIVPDDVLDRPKRGFQVPLAMWFRGPLQSAFLERCLSASSPLFTIMRPKAVSRIFEENLRGSDHGNRLWMLFTLSTWLSTYGA